MHAADEIVESFSKLFSRWAEPGHLEHENRWGIDVAFSRQRPGEVLFRFVTKDEMLIEMVVDAHELAQRGREYVDSRVELLLDQLHKARAERQRDHSLLVLPEPPAARKPVNGAVANVLKSEANG